MIARQWIWWMAALLMMSAGLVSTAQATPSTQVWIPSTDIQKYKVVHLNYDVYARPSKTPVLQLGPTIGLLPFEKIQLEAGFDLTFCGVDNDKNPLYLHAKLGTPEDALFKFMPAVAVGIYNAGTKYKNAEGTNQNVGYALVARSLPVVGRVSAGYFVGNSQLLIDENGDAANHGLLLSWDRTMSEISDKLWLAVDYQGSQSALGALNAGFSWAFTPNISVLLGYDHYFNEDMAGKDTFTVQLDINM